jgi:hypothetical protein
MFRSPDSGRWGREDTISLLRRLAALYPDEVIAGILNRQGRKTATGERFNANQVGSLRRYRNIPRFQPSTEPAKGEVATIRKAARMLGLNTSTIHRWLADGFIAGEQITPGAPWQIRITDELRARVVAEAPPEYLPMLETTMKLGVSRQTVKAVDRSASAFQHTSIFHSRMRLVEYSTNARMPELGDALKRLYIPACELVSVAFLRERNRTG